VATINELLLLPPLAIARLGGSDTPLEAFDWVLDRNPHAAHRTTIRPAVTLEVAEDGSARPYLPSVIRFRDAGRLRPVAPFFELWARVQRDRSLRRAQDPSDAGVGAQGLAPEPVTLALLDELQVSLESIKYTLTVGNRKAERRTQSTACAFFARVSAGGGDFRRKPLLASSPHKPHQEPLVFEEGPVPLGFFQVIRPARATSMGVDLSAIRVRFTPARGEVYGPPDAVTAMASAVPPGFPTARLAGRLHEIVKPENRILNPNTPWSTYYWDAKGQMDPQPSDSYDGAHEGELVSWGVVDDTCDGLIQAELVVDGERHTASARVLAAVPDYAPDRRHIFSFAEDLADRDLPPRPVSEGTLPAVEDEIADLFTRVFEYVSQCNLDSVREFTIEDNASAPQQINVEGLPQIDSRTMTAGEPTMADGESYARTVKEAAAVEGDGAVTHGVPHDWLPYARVARAVHAKLTDIDVLLYFLRENAGRVRQLVRPPFGRFWQLEEQPQVRPAAAFRDPRVVRDTLQDMRMPPYVRDSDENPLSLSWRQYRELMDLVTYLERTPAHELPGPLQRRVRAMAAKIRFSERKVPHG